MKIEKLYFKWERSLNLGKFKLDKVLSKNEIDTELQKDNDWFTINSRANVKIKIDANSKIEAMFFRRDSMIGEFEISWKFIKKVKDEFSSTLEVCEEDYTGDKLILHFGDSFLHAATLIRKIH